MSNETERPIEGVPPPLPSPSVDATAELRNIADARRFDRTCFDDDTAFADWAQNRARHCVERINASRHIASVLPALQADVAHPWDSAATRSLFRQMLQEQKSDAADKT
jgi:hypothetical protein